MTNSNRSLTASTLVMLLHEMAFKWADGCPKTYTRLLQDLFSSNGIPPVKIPASLTELRPLPSATERVREFKAATENESAPLPISSVKLRNKLIAKRSISVDKSPIKGDGPNSSKTKRRNNFPDISKFLSVSVSQGSPDKDTAIGQTSDNQITETEAPVPSYYDSEDELLHHIYIYLLGLPDQKIFPPQIECLEGEARTNQRRNFKKAVTKCELSDDRSHLIKTRKVKKDWIRTKVVLDPEERQRIMTSFHQGLGEAHGNAALAGHNGRDITIKKIGSHFYWPRFSEHVRELVANCPDCKEARIARAKKKDEKEKDVPPLQPITVPGKVWSKIEDDICSQPTTDNSHRQPLQESQIRYHDYSYPGSYNPHHVLQSTNNW